MFVKLKSPEEALAGPLMERAQWLWATVSTSIPWPVAAQIAHYGGDEFWIVPVTTTTAPAVAVKTGTQGYDEGRPRILRFLSALSWAREGRLAVKGFGGGGIVRPSGWEVFQPSIANELNLDDLPAPSTPEAALALALMREGRSLDHSGYAFLSFFRALERAFGTNQKAKGPWILEALPRLRDRRAIEVIGHLRAKGLDIADHLYVTRRHALAHAKGGHLPVIDPDDPQQSAELDQERPLIMELAQLAIEEKLGVKTSSTIYREHLYELAGFKKRLGDEFIGKLLRSEPLGDSLNIDLERIHVGLKGLPPFPPLQDLQLRQAHLQEGLLGLTFVNARGTARVTFWLNFAEERLVFEFQRDLVAHDDGSPEAARDLSDVLHFTERYVGNGRLIIHDAENGDVLSEREAYVPVNFWANHEWFVRERERLDGLAVSRSNLPHRAASQKPRTDR